MLSVKRMISRLCPESEKSMANWSPGKRATVSSGAEERLNAAAKNGQQAIAGIMPQAIIHGLEAVDVDKDDMKIVGVGLGDFALQPVHEQGAVGKAGDPVIDRIAEQAFLGSLWHW